MADGRDFVLQPTLLAHLAPPTASGPGVMTASGPLQCAGHPALAEVEEDVYATLDRAIVQAESLSRAARQWQDSVISDDSKAIDGLGCDRPGQALSELHTSAGATVVASTNTAVHWPGQQIESPQPTRIIHVGYQQAPGSMPVCMQALCGPMAIGHHPRTGRSQLHGLQQVGWNTSMVPAHAGPWHAGSQMGLLGHVPNIHYPVNAQPWPGQHMFAPAAPSKQIFTQAAPMHSNPPGAAPGSRIPPASFRTNRKRSLPPEILKPQASAAEADNSMTLEQKAAESASAAVAAAAAHLVLRTGRSNSTPTPPTSASNVSAATPTYGLGSHSGGMVVQQLEVAHSIDWASTNSANTTAASTPTGAGLPVYDYRTQAHHNFMTTGALMASTYPAFLVSTLSAAAMSYTGCDVSTVQPPASPPPLQLPGTIRYACRGAEIDMLISQMMSGGKPKVVGFDMEWKPTFVKGQAPNPVALIQLAYYSNSQEQGSYSGRVVPETFSGMPGVSGQVALGGWGYDSGASKAGSGGGGAREPHVVALLLQISGLTALPPGLTAVLTDPEVAKAGVGIQGDINKLRLDWHVSLASAVDLADLANSRVLHDVPLVTTDVSTNSWSLAGLACTVLRRSLSKSKQVRLSDWEQQPLSQQQQQYAALDAYAGLALYHKLQHLPLRPPMTLERALNDEAERTAGGTAVSLN